jgi:hypothetical protein
MSYEGSNAMHERSVALFGNARMLDVVLALDELGSGTAKQIAEGAGAPYTNARDALIRLVVANAVNSSRVGEGARAPVFYTARDSDQWRGLLTLARAAATEVATQTVARD